MSKPSRARYLMVGGFLGAGKTTAVARLARHLTDQGLRVGLITNDQGSQLVDTAFLVSKGFATEEIPGGCFCCRFNSLVDAANKLTDRSRPDVFVAEPVGSCTDLVATVTYPLRRIYGNQFTIAPLSVLIDPIRARRIFGLDAGGKFSEKVLYIYRKQLQEADCIVINKIDLLASEDLAALQTSLGREFPAARLFTVSARTGLGLTDWFEHLAAAEQGSRTSMEIDYDTYAEGEALLGWLNSTVRLQSASPFDGNQFVRLLAEVLQQELIARQAEIAHLKMTLSAKEDFGDLAVVNVVRNDLVAELGQELEEDITSGQLIVNLRAEGDPAELGQALQAALTQSRGRQPQVDAMVEHLETFRPGRPVPTHRAQGPAG